MAGILKKTTGLTGLNVLKKPHEELTFVYKKILQTLKDMPDTAAYKRYTMNTVNERMKIVQSEKVVSELEKKIGCGQVEELLIQAKNELSLAQRFLKDKPWEPLCTKAPDSQWKWPI